MLCRACPGIVRYTIRRVIFSFFPNFGSYLLISFELLHGLFSNYADFLLIRVFIGRGLSSLRWYFIHRGRFLIKKSSNGVVIRIFLFHKDNLFHIINILKRDTRITLSNQIKRDYSYIPEYYICILLHFYCNLFLESTNSKALSSCPFTIIFLFSFYYRRYTK